MAALKPTRMRAIDIEGKITRGMNPSMLAPTARRLPAGAAGALAWSRNLPGRAIVRFNTAVSACEP
jgi:hypothetical protein